MVFGMWGGERKKELAEAAPGSWLLLLLGVSFDFSFVNLSCLLMVLVHVDLWAYILGGESYESRGRGARKGQENGGAMEVQEGGGRRGWIDAGLQLEQERERDDRGEEGERK